MIRWLSCLVILFSALAGSAVAQGTINWGDLCPIGFDCWQTGKPRQLTGDRDLDRAVAVCDQHTVSTSTIPAGRAFGPDWDACHKVMSLWDASDAALRERDRKKQEAEDLDFVNGYAERAAK